MDNATVSCWPRGVMVSTQDSESCDPSSNLGGTWYFFKLLLLICMYLTPHDVKSRALEPGRYFMTCSVCWRYSRDRIVVSTSRCGRDNPGSNPGHGRGCEVSIRLSQPVFCKRFPNLGPFNGTTD